MKDWTAQQYLYTATQWHLCAVQIHQACRGIFFPALLLQFLVDQLSSVSPVLVPDPKGAWPGQRSPRIYFSNAYTHLLCSKLCWHDLPTPICMRRKKTWSVPHLWIIDLSYPVKINDCHIAMHPVCYNNLRIYPEETEIRIRSFIVSCDNRIQL